MKDFPWLKQYPEGVAQEVNLRVCLSCGAVRGELQEVQDRVAFENMGVELTYHELDNLAGNFAALPSTRTGIEER